MNVRVSMRTVIVLLFVMISAQVCKTQGITPISLISLKLQMSRNDVPIGNATGFVVVKNGKYYLITNRHVVLFCVQDQDPADIGGWICANKLSIFHNRKDHAGEWFWVKEDLLDGQGHRRWVEHPTLAGSVDLIALPLVKTEGVEFHPLDIETRKVDIVVAPGESVSIVGFPFGQAQSAGLPIWKSGTVASDLGVNWSDRPMFLVDTTSRPGMSGSPVYAVRVSAFRTSTGALAMLGGGVAAKFLGVYSEQITQAELGGVWKADIVQALYDSLP